MENQSKYDPSRKTVGAIYRDIQTPGEGNFVTAGDMTAELEKSLVDDLNETIRVGAIEFCNRPFYITVHEKKDLQMPRALLRRLIKTEYRPWPEDDTIVFWVDPPSNDIRFCWCLPHTSEMDNMLANSSLFEQDMIREIVFWKSFQLEHFGFIKDAEGNYVANPHWNPRIKDKPMAPPKKKSNIIVPLHLSKI